MNTAKSDIFFLIISIIMILQGFVLVSGCIGSAFIPKDMTTGDPAGSQVSHRFSPMFNYPDSGPVTPDDGTPGQFASGDILQPSESSPVFDRDIAIVIIRDTGNGSYEIDGLARSGSTWGRLSGSVPGIVSHTDVERLFPDRVGHVDIATLPVLKGTGG